MCRKITALLLSVTMLLAMTVSLNACKDDGTHSPFTQQSYRTDTDPLKSRFPALGEIERAYWKTYIFGRGLYSCIGPTSYRLTGFVSTDVADKLMYKQYTEVKKVDFPDGIEPEVTGFTDFEWRKYPEFTEKVLGNKYLGLVFVDIGKNLVYIDIENF